MSEPALIRAPEGVELAIVVFLVSDATGLEAVMRLGGFPVLAPFTEGVIDGMELVNAHGGLPDVPDDWRVMTRAEIRDYKQREADGE